MWKSASFPPRMPLCAVEDPVEITGRIPFPFHIFHTAPLLPPDAPVFHMTTWKKEPGSSEASRTRFPLFSDPMPSVEM